MTTNYPEIEDIRDDAIRLRLIGYTLLVYIPIDVIKWTRKLWKAKLKAEKKDQKNYDKWVGDTEKARDKSSAELAEFFQAVLDQASAAREENAQ